MATGLHIDVPLSNLSVAAFQTMGDFVAQKLFPIVPVDKQSNKYYTIDQDSWQRIPTTYRAPKTRARLVEFKVSSDSYFADNYALGTDNALEDLSNADIAIQLRQTGIDLVTRQLLADYERRVAQLCITGAGTTQRLTAAVSGTPAASSAWDAVNSADIISCVREAKRVVYGQTGIVPNTVVLDWQSMEYAQRNTLAFARFQYVEGGMLTLPMLKTVWGVDNVLVSNAQFNSNLEAGTASRSSIWGPTALVCYVPPVAPSLRMASFGASFRWAPDGFPGPMAVTRNVEQGAGTMNREVLEAQYFQDEKVLASALGFYINTKSGTPW